MRNNFFSGLATIILFILLTGSKCNKETVAPTEENLRISIDAPAYIENPGPDFNFNLKVESAMPAAGVRIVFVVKGETDNQDYPQDPAIETSGKTTPITLRNLPRQKFCICTVTVTSKSKSTNTAAKNFRVVYK